MSPADIPGPAESDEPPAGQAVAHTASMRMSVRLLAATAAAGGVLLAFDMALMWATGLTWRIDQPRDPASSVFVSADVSSRGDGWSGLLLVIPLASAAFAGMGALRRRPRLIRLSTAPAVLTFAATWALIVYEHFWRGFNDEFNAYGHAISVTLRPGPRIEATWPAALLLSAVVLAAVIGAWRGLRDE